MAEELPQVAEGKQLLVPVSVLVRLLVLPLALLQVVHSFAAGTPTIFSPWHSSVGFLTAD
jgi:hypothetical protein